MKFDGITVENKYMVPIACDDCGKELGYGWDAEYGHPQSVFRCKECFDKFASNLEGSPYL
jgi:ribosomal protein S27E